MNYTTNLNSSPTYSPKVTVITAVFNAKDYLGGCIESVQNQTYKNFEHIIIDGGSTDGTLNIIKKYHNKLSYWISEPDQGIYDAWNKALKVAKGDWIAFIGSDDQLYPDALQSYVQHINNHPKQNDLEFISSLIDLVDKDLLPIRTVGEPWTWDRFRNDMCTWHVGCFHSKQLFEKYGVFDSSYKTSGDYEFLLRPKNHLVTSFINHSTAKMRIGGVSSKWVYKAIDETYRAKITNGVISATKGNLKIIIDKLRVISRNLLST